MAKSLIEKIAVRVVKNSGYRIESGYTNSRESYSKIQSGSLLNWYGNVYSQRGQDSILSEIFRRLGISKGFFVEFGAWDGIYLSNSRFLFEKGWGGCYIEGDTSRFQTLVNNYKAYNDIHKINAFVQTSGENSLDALLKKENIRSVDFLSIDIDGYDLEILRSLADADIKPKVIVIEGGFNFSPYLETEIAAEVANDNVQQPLHVILEAAKKIGYEPVCYFQDSYLVRKDLYELFSNIKNDAITLFEDAWSFAGETIRKEIIENHLNKKLDRFEKNLSENRRLASFAK